MPITVSAPQSSSSLLPQDALWRGSPNYSSASSAPSASLAKTDPKPTLIVGLIGLVCILTLVVIYCKFFYKYCTACDVGLQRSGSRVDYFRRTFGLDNQEGGAAAVGGGGGGAGAGGLTQNAIRIIPVFEFRKSDGVFDACKECAICLSGFEEDDKVRLLPTCRHGFHVSCIDAWLQSHASCPLCRCDIVALEKCFVHQAMAPPLPYTTRDFPLVSTNSTNLQIEII